MTLYGGQFGYLYQRGLAVGRGGRLRGRQHAGQGIGQIETYLTFAVGPTDEIHHRLGEGGVTQNNGLLPPALAKLGDKLQLLECNDGLLFFIEQRRGTDSKGGMAQADMDLPQRQVQTIVFGQPGGQVALGESRRLP